jgi:hypothetical protein
LGATSRLARRLHSGQEQRDQHRDDGDDHEQLNERETTPQTGIHLKAPRMKRRQKESWDLFRTTKRAL